MGIRMVPCAVRTDKGDVRLVGGYSELHGFSSRSFDDDKAYVAAKEFASKTSFQKAKRVKRKIPAPIDDDVGIIELHQRSADVDPTGQVLEETCVLIGEPVCAIGHYSRMKNAFIQNGWSTVIYRGRPDTALSEATTHTLIYRVLAVVFLGVGTVGIWVGLSKWT